MLLWAICFLALVNANTVPKSNTNRQCGKPDIKPDVSAEDGANVINGKEAKRGSWPWQILMNFGSSHFSLRCGGSIISEKWIVTASHCVVGDEKTPEKFSVRVGEHNRWSTEGSEVDIPVERVISHPKFDKHTYNNDIALFKLAKPIKFNKYVSPICLPTTEVKPGTNCYVTGWGQTEREGLAHVLKQGKLPVVTNKECWIHNNHRHHPVYDGMLCAGVGKDGHISACHGDSGGPFVCERDGVWELHGSVSFGMKYCTSKYYSVFSRTTQYVKWIKEQMKKYGEN